MSKTKLRNFNTGGFIDIFNNKRLSTPMYVTPQMFGAKANGITDDTQAIKNAVAFLKDGDTLFFPQGVYQVSALGYRDNIIDLKYLNNISIQGDTNSIIILKPNSFRGFNIININSCDNFVIEGLTIKGDRKDHSYIGIEDGVTHALGMAINIMYENNYAGTGKNMNGIIKNCEFFDMTGDGICMRNGGSATLVRDENNNVTEILDEKPIYGRITIDNCYIHHCRRQGISVLNCDEVVVKNCEICYIGHEYESGHYADPNYIILRGSAPMAGIDLEPDQGTYKINKFTLLNSHIHHTDHVSVISAFGRVKQYSFCNNFLASVKVGKSIWGYESANFYNHRFILDGEHWSYPYSGLADEGKYANCSFDCQRSNEEEFLIDGYRLDNCTILGSLGTKTVVDINEEEKEVPLIRLYGSHYTGCDFYNVRIMGVSPKHLNNFKNDTFFNSTFACYGKELITFALCDLVDNKVIMLEKKEAMDSTVSYNGCVLDIPLLKNPALNNSVITN